ncbi:helix-turn-helix domain-containing protein [Alicyclobacillus dauci]|uniref:AraC family transcriptional regulator n=1 Tax=Alicyclobacillus dauci TaxID=1475485 RepID=A0ABY6Z7J3_9BACL|nr:AraC family transcriptional regulator [Alicyclobacillus dauci]WAH38873.1 AraC family transcriptional regulator [Alicyclobacillus dauci]
MERCLDERNILLIPCHCEHTFYSHRRNEFLVVDIPEFLLGQEHRQPKGTWYPFDEKWKAIRFLIIDALEQGESKSSVLMDLFPYVVKQLFRGVRPVSIQYIDDHFDEDVTLEQLASIENYSVSHYSQWFRRKTGKTPTVYQQEIRLEHAQQLLRDTSLPIGRIAREIGMQHQSSLTRLFQKHLGMTPAAYKKTMDLAKKDDIKEKSAP